MKNYPLLEVLPVRTKRHLNLVRGFHRRGVKIEGGDGSSKEEAIRITGRGLIQPEAIVLATAWMTRFATKIPVDERAFGHKSFRTEMDGYGTYLVYVFGEGKEIWIDATDFYNRY